MPLPTVAIAYYCSGHGYGHATRVSAFAQHLLSLDNPPTISIVSPAPERVFADSIARGARYRFAEIDPVVVQPLAYRVDRRKSVDVLEAFLKLKDVKLAQEVKWLKEAKIDLVLSDAAFLGCSAAHTCGIPSVLITNFSFDSVYSYLSTPHVDQSKDAVSPALLSSHLGADISCQPDPHDLVPDEPIPLQELRPLVEQIWMGYRCADLLFQLPGEIPMPSFFKSPSLPAEDWVDSHKRQFHQSVSTQLDQQATASAHDLHPALPFCGTNTSAGRRRTVVRAPLLVRSPNSDIYTPAGRTRLLASIGVPESRHDPDSTNVLVVSFGGQTFKRPQSRNPSRSGSSLDLKHHPIRSRLGPANDMNGSNVGLGLDAVALAASADIKRQQAPTPINHAAVTMATGSSRDVSQEPTDAAFVSAAVTPASLAPEWSAPRTDTALLPKHEQAEQAAQRRASLGSPRPGTRRNRPPAIRLASASHIFVPGAPPALKTPVSQHSPVFSKMIPVSPLTSPVVELASPTEEISMLLPDSSWIAVVCGVPSDWGREAGEDLPDGFYVAPRDIYMPDLTAIGDVLLGKLGYGTVSECVDACTPFVYVSRPLFIEEHGLRRLLERKGVGVELARAAYEGGDWSGAVQDAYEKGKVAKARKRAEGEVGLRAQEGREMARGLMSWYRKWQDSSDESL